MIKKDVYEKLCKYPAESCGFLLEKNGVIYKDVPVRNVSTEYSQFKMSKIDVVKFVFNNIFKKNNIYIYHTHKKNHEISELDVLNTLPYFKYLLICQGVVYLYELKNGIVEQKYFFGVPNGKL